MAPTWADPGLLYFHTNMTLKNECHARKELEKGAFEIYCTIDVVAEGIIFQIFLDPNLRFHIYGWETEERGVLKVKSPTIERDLSVKGVGINIRSLVNTLTLVFYVKCEVYMFSMFSMSF